MTIEASDEKLKLFHQAVARLEARVPLVKAFGELHDETWTKEINDEALIMITGELKKAGYSMREVERLLPVIGNLIVFWYTAGVMNKIGKFY